MNYQRTNDYGEMRRVRKNIKRQPIKKFIWKYLTIKQLRKNIRDVIDGAL